MHAGTLGDPFVLRWNGRFYAYGTPPGGPIPVLVSDDLVSWEEAGTVLAEPPAGEVYWAPEVAYDNGTFHLYYSVGGPEGEGHQVRVATAEDPLGPFEALGDPLDPTEPFSIDASPFLDVDGNWYLYSCRDFLDGPRVGTGIVVHRLAPDLRTLDGPATVVVRPHAEWHVYERQRRWYGQVWDWYTVEGPFVIRSHGRYWCFFSGGAWRADHYGVTWAVSDHPLGPWTPAPEGAAADILRTAPGAVGPGHASVVLGPDNRTHHLAYHAWDQSLAGRRLCVDALRWDAESGVPLRSGPSVAPIAIPPGAVAGFVEERTVAGAVEVGQVEGGGAIVEVNVAGRGASAYGVSIGATTITIVPDERLIRAGAQEVPLPASFRPDRYHQLLVRGAAVELDGRAVPITGSGQGIVTLRAIGGAAAFAGVRLS